ncbi:PTS sugar transporter subunit IIA, partial [Staphylococcus piscifermentans]
MTNLIFENSVFITNASSKEDVFRELARALKANGDVKSEFLEHVLEREKNYPTGMDLSLLDIDYPNIAIPHTETEFVNVTKIIPVKLNHPIDFQNMISPHNTIKVSFLFMILNHDK